MAEETNADVKCPAKVPSGTVLLPVPDASVTISAIVPFPRINEYYVSEARIREHDLRISEKEDAGPWRGLRMP